VSSTAVGQALVLPPEEVGPALLRIVEDQWFERKAFRISAPALADTVIGMANADGGTVVIGLSDGEVKGTTHDPKHRNALQQAAVDFSDPPVRMRCSWLPCVNSDGDPDELLVVDVEPSEVVHANRKDEVFLRVGDENRRLSFRQRQELLYDKGQAVFETTVITGLASDDLDSSLLESYARAAGHPDPERLLRARGLVTVHGDVTAACCLLFGVQPQATFPEAHVRVLRYRGTERRTGARQEKLSDVRIDGPIPRLLTDAATAVREVQPTRRALQPSGRFGPVGLVPDEAWLEGIVNAVVHRSYSAAGDHIRVDVFDDRIEIESPGRFPGLAYSDDPLEITHFARNPRIARVCADLSFGQELGEGIRRMFDEMRMAGLTDPLYRQTAGSVVLTLSTALANRDLDARLSENARRILHLIRQAGRLGTGELVDATGWSRPTVLAWLRTLQQAGLVEWVGKSTNDPRAYWQARPA
jgi:ATP-dependent DNA helicase RecG